MTYITANKHKWQTFIYGSRMCLFAKRFEVDRSCSTLFLKESCKSKPYNLLSQAHKYTARPEIVKKVLYLLGKALICKSSFSTKIVRYTTLNKPDNFIQF